jgi:hypothetical protein
VPKRGVPQFVSGSEPLHRQRNLGRNHDPFAWVGDVRAKKILRKRSQGARPTFSRVF